MAAVDEKKETNGMNGVTEEEAAQLLAEEEEEKAKMRPADIDQDMKEMDRRKRVDNIMNSALFREELERIIETQIHEGYTGYQTLQNISEMMGIPTSKNTTVFRGAQSVIPINDIRGSESLNYAKGEKLLRCKLAAVYRLIDMHGWTESIYNHCTARISQDTEHFLLNPFGLLFHEVTAATLVKVDMQGNVVDLGSTNFGVNTAGFCLHSAIHAARPDIRCIIHIHHPATVAVSAMKQGLLPLCQESLMLGDIAYHEYQGIVVDPAEKELLGRNLGPVNKVMFLRNHGVVCCGETIEESWYLTYYTVRACEVQMQLAPIGFDNVIMVSEEAQQAAYEVSRRGGGGVDSKQEGGPNQDGPKERKWKVGEMEFESLMRSLDNFGLRTGHIYKRPLVKMEPTKLSDVALPPTASNFAHLFDEDEMNRSPLRRILDGRKAQDKSRWLNSPNVYSKVEVLETGTPDPKKITKWVADDSPTHSTPVKLDDNLMFVPKDTNPKEFKKIQKMIKENRRVGNISAGPTSHVLEGVSWEEAQRMQDASMSSATDRVILVGAASKGIIQRDFQHNAVVYKTPYAKNPFDAVSDQEIEDYKRTIERKQKGEPEEIEVEQMNITREVALRDVVDDSNMVTSHMSPMSDEEVTTSRQVHLETKMAPRASKAQPVVINDDIKSSLQKPPLPPKPNIPKPTNLQGGSLGAYSPPQKVQASMKMLPPRGERWSSSPRKSSARATLPRTPMNKSQNLNSSRSNSLSRGLAKMLKLSRSKEHVVSKGAVVSLAQCQHVVTKPINTLVHPEVLGERLRKSDQKSEVYGVRFLVRTPTKSFNVSSVTLPSSVKGDALANGDENDPHQSTFSHSSKEGSPTKDTSLTDDSVSKDKKKKKKGLRTPSFLKKKKDKKKEKEALHS